MSVQCHKVICMMIIHCQFAKLNLPAVQGNFASLSSAVFFVKIFISKQVFEITTHNVQWDIVHDINNCIFDHIKSIKLVKSMQYAQLSIPTLSAHFFANCRAMFIGNLFHFGDFNFKLSLLPREPCMKTVLSIIVTGAIWINSSYILNLPNSCIYKPEWHWHHINYC